MNGCEGHGEEFTGEGVSPYVPGEPGITVAKTLLAAGAAATVAGLALAHFQRRRGERPTFWNPHVSVPVSLAAGAACAAFLGPAWPGARRRLDRRDAVALTFDDGPNPFATPLILDALAHAGARATFFVLAANAVRYPALTRRIAAEGHTPALHGWDHRPITWWGPVEIERRLAQAAHAVEDITGVPIRWYRAPYGFRGPVLPGALRRLGWEFAGWRLDSGDWRAPSPAALVERVVKRARGGDIVLMHDGGPNAALTAAALPLLLQRYRERGVELVSLDAGKAGEGHPVRLLCKEGLGVVAASLPS